MSAITTCPECGEGLSSAYQKLGNKPPQFVVFCKSMVRCPGYLKEEMGRGDTVQEAMGDYEKRNCTNQRNLIQ